MSASSYVNHKHFDRIPKSPGDSGSLGFYGTPAQSKATMFARKPGNGVSWTQSHFGGRYEKIRSVTETIAISIHLGSYRK